MKGYDQTINVILEQSHERVFSEDNGVEQNPLGLYIIRGDNMWVNSFWLYFSFIIYYPFSAIIGELDEEEDSKKDLSTILAPPLKPIAHS